MTFQTDRRLELSNLCSTANSYRKWFDLVHLISHTGQQAYGMRIVKSKALLGFSAS